MKQETKEKMDCWLSQHPESTHPLDERRKFEFVKALCLNKKDEVAYDDLYQSFRAVHSDYDEKYSQELCEKFDIEISMLERFGNFLMGGQ